MSRGHHKPRYVVDEKEIVAKHFARLTRLLREEEKKDHERFEKEISEKSPEEREKGGKALLRLSLFALHYNPSGQRLLTFGYADGRPLPRYSLAAGDVVSLAGFKTPKIERPIGIVYEKDRKKITVAFGGKIPSWVGRDDTYHLNLSENVTTYQRMHDALKEAGYARHNRLAFFRNISLGLKQARFGDPVKPEDVAFLDSRLNEMQKTAVCRALEAQDIFLIHGPPGTGKTYVLVEIIRQAQRNGETILVSAPSNAACDHVVECLVASKVPVTRLGHSARVSEGIRPHTLSYKLAHHPYAKLIDENQARLEQLDKQKERRRERRVMSWEERREVRDEFRELRHDIRQLRAEIFQQVWNASDVVVATHTVCGDAILKGRVFDWVIIDEATQGTEPSTWIPIARGNKAVLAGDHRQLPPTVFSPKTGRESLCFTLFERLHEVLDEGAKIRLETQYRMHREIMKFSSEEFYEGKLAAAPEVSDHVLADIPGVKDGEAARSPVVFLDTAGLGFEEKIDGASESRLNKEEADLVVREYERLLELGVPSSGVAVISPYSAQVKLLSTLIRGPDRDEWQAGGPEIDSIDAFQGREKEAVIVSLVRSNLSGKMGFLADTRRMNVAMTRARRKLIVIGDSATISTIPFYEDFIRYTESVGGYKSAWEYKA